MSGSRLLLLWASVGLVAGTMWGGQAPRRPAGAEGEADVYLPLALCGVRMEDLPTAAPADTATLTPTTAPTSTPSATETVVVPPPTITPLPTFTPEPTEPDVPSSITGHIVFERKPLPEGFGSTGGPQIELRRCNSADGQPCPLADWERVATAITDEEGAYVFRSPPPLGEGQLYQVWWTNDDTPDVQGDSSFVNRWWSRTIDALGPGDDVDLGTFDVTDLKYVAICHDCGQSLPIVFRWNSRPNSSEDYRWSLFRGCGDNANREGAYRTPSLGHASQYTLASPPPGFRLDEKYCWYVFIEDGDNGTGWPFFEWRVTFLPTPGLATTGDWLRSISGLGAALQPR
jgi:hypothetical protein